MSITRAEHIVNFTAWVTVTTTACFLAAQALLLGAFLVNGDEGISDTWVGYTSATTTIAALAISLVALAVAVWAAARGVRHRFAWLMR
ncbi:MAG: hypothetical protein EB138_05525, partial [Actinobacteria bacterium]|nr:hypothetical protein [Actinomycetota bacterium]